MSSSTSRSWLRILPLAVVALVAGSGCAASRGQTLRATGTIQISPADPCGTNSCNFDVSGSIADRKGNTALIGGSGSIDPGACTNNIHGTKLCCSTSFSGVATPPFSFAQSGTVDFSFAGTTCQKPTVITLNGAINVTSGAGVFTGITGSGKLKGKLDPSSWGGSVSAHGNYSLPP